jgi:hypothetical protein
MHRCDDMDNTLHPSQPAVRPPPAVDHNPSNGAQISQGLYHSFLQEKNVLISHLTWFQGRTLASNGYIRMGSAAATHLTSISVHGSRNGVNLNWAQQGQTEHTKKGYPWNCHFFPWHTTATTRSHRSLFVLGAVSTTSNLIERLGSVEDGRVITMG